MKIAIFHNLPSGGAKRTLYEATKRLSANHQIDVYTLSTANHDFADMRSFATGYHVFEFTPTPLFSSPFGRINQAIRMYDLVRLRSVSRAIAEKIELANYDVAFIQPCQFENSPSLLRYLYKTPTVFYCHEPLRKLYEEIPERPYNQKRPILQQALRIIDPLPSLYHRFLKSTDRRNIRSAKVVLVNSEFIWKAVKEIYQVNARVSYHGVDTKLFRPISIEKQPILLSVGSLTPLKGFDFLIRALSELPARRDLTLVIVSNFENPPERCHIQELAEKCEVEIRFQSNVSDETLVKLYNQAILTLYAPVREPFGLVALESMACGTPLVAVHEGGIRESIKHGVTGLLVERRENEFARAVEQMLSDPALREKLGQDGRKHVERNWTLDRAMIGLEDVLHVFAH